ncbi:hypothetical protein JCM39068_08630 [Desulfocastanea catecholica]
MSTKTQKTGIDEFLICRSTVPTVDLRNLPHQMDRKWLLSLAALGLPVISLRFANPTQGEKP